MLPMKDKFKGIVLRSFIWNTLYFAINIFAMLYLVNKKEIKNFDIVFVFLPLLILAVSSETMSRNKEHKSFRVKPFCIIDFIAKVILYILAQTAYRRLCIDFLFFLLLTVVILLGVVSYVLEILMVKRLKREAP